MARPEIDLPALLSGGQKLILGWSELADPMMVGLMARSGYDAILLDAQHGHHTKASLLACIAEAALCNTPVLVRVETGAFSAAASALDMGASGVVAPMINSAGDAIKFVSEVKYPPLGNRSWGAGRAMRIQGENDPVAFIAQQNRRCLAIAMIETRAALDDIDEILAVPGLDGILLGPGDLSLSLSGGEFNPLADEVIEATLAVLDKTRACGKLSCAFAGDLARAEALFAAGFQLVSPGYDVQVVGAAFERVNSQMRAALRSDA